jgi:hypothetical protein
LKIQNLASTEWIGGDGKHPSFQQVGLRAFLNGAVLEPRGSTDRFFAISADGKRFPLSLTSIHVAGTITPSVALLAG